MIDSTLIHLSVCHKYIFMLHFILQTVGDTMCLIYVCLSPTHTKKIIGVWIWHPEFSRPFGISILKVTVCLQYVCVIL